MTAAILAARSVAHSSPADKGELFERRLAELTRSLFETALERGIAGSTIDFQLSLWDELREVLNETRAFAPRGSTLSTDGRGVDLFLTQDV